MTAQLERASGRVPPHNREAEESVLGAVMLSQDAANIALERLHPEDFYDPAHQLVFEVVVELFDSNQPIDAITVSDHLARREALQRLGGVGYLTNLLDMVPTTSNIDYYAAVVEEHALRRRLMRAATQVGALAQETTAPIAEILDEAEMTVFQVAERRIGEGLLPISPMINPVLERADEMHGKGLEVTGLATGFRDLDRKLTGLHPANLVVIAARPSMGKSSLALNIAHNVALEGTTAAVFTLEMSREETVQRLLCSHAKVDSQRLRTGDLTPAQWQKLSRAASTLYEAPIFVDDSAAMTPTEIRAKCRRIARRHDLGLVVVDYLQLMSGGGRRHENRQQEIADISRALKSLARELEIPIIAVSQLNRSLEQRQDKRPQLGDLRESGAIEQDADVVMFIYRHEYYHPGEEQGAAEVNVAKHRAGAVGRVDMTYMPEFTLFGSISRDEAPVA